MHTLIEKYMERAFKLVSKGERRSNSRIARCEEEMRKTLLALKETTNGRKGVIKNSSPSGTGHAEECANE